jgi:hypothetical protein
MLALPHARKPAPPLAARAVWLRLHGGPDAFGSALGDSVVGAITKGDGQKAATQWWQEPDQSKPLTQADIAGFLADDNAPQGGGGNIFDPFRIGYRLTEPEGVPSLADEFGSNARERPGPYKVRRGDTLEDITDGDKSMMGRYISGSRLRDPNKIRAGQSLSANWDMSDDDAIALANRFYAADGKAKVLAAQQATVAKAQDVREGLHK